jgi:hypothetical protein
MADLIGGPSGLAAKAPKGSIQAKAYQYLLSKVKVSKFQRGFEEVSHTRVLIGYSLQQRGCMAAGVWPEVCA